MYNLGYQDQALPGTSTLEHGAAGTADGQDYDLGHQAAAGGQDYDLGHQDALANAGAHSDLNHDAVPQKTGAAVHVPLQLVQPPLASTASTTRSKALNKRANKGKAAGGGALLQLTEDTDGVGHTAM